MAAAGLGSNSRMYLDIVEVLAGPVLEEVVEPRDELLKRGATGVVRRPALLHQRAVRARAVGRYCRSPVADDGADEVADHATVGKLAERLLAREKLPADNAKAVQ